MYLGLQFLEWIYKDVAHHQGPRSWSNKKIRTASALSKGAETWMIYPRVVGRCTLPHSSFDYLVTQQCLLLTKSTQKPKGFPRSQSMAGGRQGLGLRANG